MKLPKHFRTRSNRLDQGFTLVEVLVVIGLAALIGLISFGISIGGFQRNAFWSEKDLLITVLQTARSKSLINSGQVAHGVYIKSDAFILFEDTDKNGAYTSGTDKSIVFPADTTVSHAGDNEFIFEQLSGNKISSGSQVILTGVRPGDSTTINVYDNGRIDWVWN